MMQVSQWSLNPANFLAPALREIVLVGFRLVLLPQESHKQIPLRCPSNTFIWWVSWMRALSDTLGSGAACHLSSYLDASLRTRHGPSQPTRAA